MVLLLDSWYTLDKRSGSCWNYIFLGTYQITMNYGKKHKMRIKEIP